MDKAQMNKLLQFFGQIAKENSKIDFNDKIKN